MPVSIACPACGACLRAPDAAAGRTLHCPRCTAAVAVPTPTPPADFTFDTGRSDPDDANPFADAGPAEEADRPRQGRRPTAKKPASGYNPFDADADESAAGGPPRRRRYRKDADYNPFGDLPADEVPDPVGEGFEFGVEAPPPTPAGEFDFGPLDPRADDPRRRRR